MDGEPLAVAVDKRHAHAVALSVAARKDGKVRFEKLSLAK